MLRCPECNQRGLSVVGTVFMIHDERLVCQQCSSAFRVPKSRKSLVIGIEYGAILVSAAVSIALRTLLPTVAVFAAIVVVRALILPKMAVKQTRTLNRLRKYRRPSKR